MYDVIQICFAASVRLLCCLCSLLLGAVTTALLISSAKFSSCYSCYCWTQPRRVLALLEPTSSCTANRYSCCFCCCCLFTISCPSFSFYVAFRPSDLPPSLFTTSSSPPLIRMYTSRATLILLLVPDSFLLQSRSCSSTTTAAAVNC